MNVISRWCKINRAPVLSMRLLIGQPYSRSYRCFVHLTTEIWRFDHHHLGTLQAVEWTLFALSGKD